MGLFKGDSNSRRIDRALQHVSKPWFPMNPDIIKRVKEGLDNDLYTSDFNALLVDLKSDFALFTFVVKELAQRAAAQNAPQSIVGNPIELIRWGGLNNLREMLLEQQKMPTIKH